MRRAFSPAQSRALGPPHSPLGAGLFVRLLCPLRRPHLLFFQSRGLLPYVFAGSTSERSLARLFWRPQFLGSIAYQAASPGKALTRKGNVSFGSGAAISPWST